MHRNPLWLAFLGVVALVVLGYSIKTGIAVFNYEQQRVSTPPAGITWSAKKVAEDSYVLQADYQFYSHQILYQGKTEFPFSYRNAFAAELAGKEESSKPWRVWYSPSNPQNSTLQKQFPIKECFYGIVLWCLLIYFVILGYRVGHERTF